MVDSKGSERWSENAKNNGRALHLSENKSADQNCIAGADRPPGANIRQLRVAGRRKIIDLDQGHARCPAFPRNDSGIRTRRQSLAKRGFGGGGWRQAVS